MARSRLLKPGFFSDEELAELPPLARLCYAGLWTLADRAGRLEDRPKRIKAALFPYDQVDAQDLLAALASKGFIRRYVVDEVAVIDIPKFLKHQNPHIREVKSELPKYEHVKEKPSAGSVLDTSQAMTSPAVSVSVLVSDPVPVSVCESPAAPGHAPADAQPRTGSTQPRGATLMSGKDHIAHAACGRICVPAFLHREFRLALGGHEDMADTRLRDWYTAVQLALDPNQAIEPDAPKFWRPRFQAMFVKPGGVQAVYAPMASEWTCPDDPPCEAGTSQFRCHQRHELEQARKARAS